MSDNSMDEMIAELKNLPIKELRKRAITLYGIPVTKEMDETDIINAVRVRSFKGDFAVEAKGDMPKPGWARIVVSKVAGQSNRPLIFCVNGYRCSVPRGLEVDVPIKVYRAMRNCRRSEPIVDETEALNSPRRVKWEWTDTYPVTLLAITDGPDPRKNHERVKEAKIRPFQSFYKQFGFWGTPTEVRAAIVNGKLDGFNPTDVGAKAA